jgi:hypothetical protein
MKHPGQRDLSSRSTFLTSNLLNVFDDTQVLIEITFLETRVGTAKITGRQVIRAFDLTGEEAAPQWAVRDEADP